MDPSATSAGESTSVERWQATPLVFVVDDDVSVRESLEPLINQPA